MLINLADIVAIGLHISALDAGGDHGNTQGIVLGVEHGLSSHIALRAEGAIDRIAMDSDEQLYRFDGKQFVGMAGLRIDVFDRDAPQAERPYFAVEAGVASMETDHGGFMDVRNSFRVEPFAFGIDARLGDTNALRGEIAVTYYNTYEDVLALSLTAAFVHRL